MPSDTPVPSCLVLSHIMLNGIKERRLLLLGFTVKPLPVCLLVIDGWLTVQRDGRLSTVEGGSAFHLVNESRHLLTTEICPTHANAYLVTAVLGSASKFIMCLCVKVVCWALLFQSVDWMASQTASRSCNCRSELPIVIADVKKNTWQIPLQTTLPITGVCEPPVLNTLYLFQNLNTSRWFEHLVWVIWELVWRKRKLLFEAMTEVYIFQKL